MSEHDLRKHAWRRWARIAVPPPSPAVQAAVGAHLARRLAPTSETVLTYRSMPGEVDLDPLVELLGVDRVRTTRTPATGPLTVHPFDGPTERHRYGFLQPTADAPTLDPASVDVVLVPAVVFGRDGSRLGHGAGYYDRLLPAIGTAERIGIAWSAMLTTSVPTDTHDVAVTSLVTEHGLVEID